MEAAVNLTEADADHGTRVPEAQPSVSVTGDTGLAERVARTLKRHGYGVERAPDANTSIAAVVLCCTGSPVLGIPRHAHERPTVVVGHDDGPCACCGSALAAFAAAWLPQQLLETQLPRILGGSMRRAETRRESKRRLRLDREHATIFIDAKVVKMRRTPFEVMAYLVGKRGEWVKQETVLREVFGARRSYDTALVRVHVHALRRALGELSGCIESQRGRGYRCSPALFTD